MKTIRNLLLQIFYFFMAYACLALPSGHAFKIIKKEVLAKYIKEYKETGKPINIVVGCASNEIAGRIKDQFKSKIDPVENWIGIDLSTCLPNHREGISIPKIMSANRFGISKETHPEHFLANPDIQMNAYDKSEWNKLVNYLKSQKVKVSGIMFEGLGLPVFEAAFLWRRFASILKKGGHVYGKGHFFISDEEVVGRFKRSRPMGLSLSGVGKNMGHILLGPTMEKGSNAVRTFRHYANLYHNRKSSPIYQNENALYRKIFKKMTLGAKNSKGRDEKLSDCYGNNTSLTSHISKITDAEIILSAFAYVNRVKYFNESYISNDWRWEKEDKDLPIFKRTEEEFFADYLAVFKEYMKSYGFSDVKYQCDKNDLASMPVCEHIVPYTYKDGTYDMSGGVFITK